MKNYLKNYEEVKTIRACSSNSLGKHRGIARFENEISQEQLENLKKINRVKKITIIDSKTIEIESLHGLGYSIVCDFTKQDWKNQTRYGNHYID